MIYKADNSSMKYKVSSFVRKKNKNKIRLSILLYAVVLVMVPVFSHAQTLKNIYDDRYNTQKKNKDVEDRSFNTTTNISNNIRNNTLTDYNFSPLYGKIGENISEKILSLEVQALDVAFSMDEPKLFTLTIKNVSKERYTISLSDNYVQNIFIDVYDELHLPLAIPTNLIVDRNNDYVSYRSITLDPKEFLTLTIDLDDYVKITKSGVYKITGRFYPEKYIEVSQRGYSKSKSLHFIESKALLISVMNIKDLNQKYATTTDQFTDIYNDKKLITRSYSPYDVVQSALTALKNENWETFFSHIDMYELYINTISTANTFKLLTSKEKQVVITKFMKRMQNGTEVNDLYPPELFSIEKTQFTARNAEVQVSVKVPRRYSILQYRYTFILIKKNTSWKIINYKVKYLGIDSVDTVQKSLGTSTEYISPSEYSR